MATLLIRDVDDAVYERLERRALTHLRSLEEEARETLRLAVGDDGDAPEAENIAALAMRLFGPENGVDLDLPPRSAELNRPPPDFSGSEYDR